MCAARTFEVQTQTASDSWQAARACAAAAIFLRLASGVANSWSVRHALLTALSQQSPVWSAVLSIAAAVERLAYVLFRFGQDNATSEDEDVVAETFVFQRPATLFLLGRSRERDALIRRSLEGDGVRSARWPRSRRRFLFV
ncbi:hypothetical protein M409DRAFT_51813 [Zasmidium cellare ATCC 36951]|uniref:Uncharacterized protein n=1 Tax=Zasmidium cellare ATCC 36951 TaxID=1080233 RepID=A0A6A6CTK1_ZASCE|nr:uncharacterized protein M409DRAFT_51813 [Zasmidium cellare ATCC 36951]KAF2170043.1 hypothetical protein M409DRAFT_51813 [Zasmidium cellare ATCC 36951]